MVYADKRSFCIFKKFYNTVGKKRAFFFKKFVFGNNFYNKGMPLNPPYTGNIASSRTKSACKRQRQRQKRYVFLFSFEIHLNFALHFCIYNDLYDKCRVVP